MSIQIRRAKKWNKYTPSHVRKYRIEKSNKYHGGATSNFMQQFEHTAEVEVKFGIFKEASKFNSRTLPQSGFISFNCYKLMKSSVGQIPPLARSQHLRWHLLQVSVWTMAKLRANMGWVQKPQVRSQFPCQTRQLGIDSGFIVFVLCYKLWSPIMFVVYNAIMTGHYKHLLQLPWSRDQ